MLLKLHKYAGLIAGLLLALTGVTGSLLVFHDTLDEWLTPQLRTQPAADPACCLDCPVDPAPAEQ